jgi:hypothetical protein
MNPEDFVDLPLPTGEAAARIYRWIDRIVAQNAAAAEMDYWRERCESVAKSYDEQFLRDLGIEPL